MDKENIFTQVGRIYSELEAAQERFRRQSGIRCPAGCGKCCASFEPDILPVEAEYLALHMMDSFKEDASAAATGLERIAGLGKLFPASVCPLQAPASAGYCTVYEGRPLVCRIFGFASYQDKNGNPEFSVCRHMPEEVRRIVSGMHGVPALIAAPEATVFSSQMEGLRPQDAASRLPLRDALVNAFQKLGMLQALGG